jgi:HK97 family phage portal protein
MSKRRRRRSSAQYEEKALTPDVWPADLLAAPTLSGVSVTPESALSVPAVANAVSLISGAIGTLPLALYREEGQGRVEATDHPAFEVIADAANDWTSSSDLRKQLAIDAMLHGDGFALANRLPSDEIYELLRAMPGSVIVEYDPATGEPVYTHNPAPGASTLGVTAQATPVAGNISRRYHWSDVIHVTPPLSINGITGVAPIAHAREAIGLALVLEQYAGRLFGNGARPSGILSFENKLDAATAARIRDSWNAAHGGAGSGKTAVLEQGGKFQQLALASTDAQFLEMRQFAIVEIARAFGVSPIMIGDASRATWSNAEQYNRQFLTYSLAPWLRGFEAAYKRVVLTPEERKSKSYSIAFDASDLLRGDSAARGEFVAKMRAAGVMTANEARALEDLPAHADGDALINPFVQSGKPTGSAAPQDKAAQ